MKRKRANKDRKNAFDKASWSNHSRKERRKKTKKSASGGRPSTPPQFQTQHEDTASGNQSELQPDQDCTNIPVPATGKVDAQTQTRQNIENKETQTEPIGHNSCHTQTESDPTCEATIQGQGNTENVSPKTNDEKNADNSVSTPPDPAGNKKEGTTPPSTCDEAMQEEHIKNKKEGQAGKEAQDSSNPKSTETKSKSYADVTSGKDSKEKNNQAAEGQR